MIGKRTKNEFRIVVAVVVVALICNIIYVKSRSNEHEDIIRFHVIANSDSREDQLLKLKVRDGLLAKIEKDIAKLSVANNKSTTTELIRNYVSKNKESICKWADRIIEKEGYDYNTTVNLGITYIPDKKYNGLYFPAGNYEALNVAIGHGKGHNWWCVLFPPLCLIDGENSEYSEELGISDKEKIVLKSKVKEMIQGYE